MNVLNKIGLGFSLLLVAGLLAVGALRDALSFGDTSRGAADWATIPQTAELEDVGCRAPASPAGFVGPATGTGGRTLRVGGGPTAARDLQAALQIAQPGDVVELTAGAEFTGNFTLPNKQGDDWVTIRPTAEVNLPPPGKRITPETAASLPRLRTPNAAAVLATAPGAHHYRLIGLDIGLGAGVGQNHGLVLLGDGSNAQRTLAAVPHDLVLERCYLHGNNTGELRRGIALNSARTAVLDSYISGCWGVGYDTQAIAGWNGPGPFKIINNYLEGAGENVLFGGGDPAIPNLVPSDIEFRHNYCAKPLTWKAGERTVGKRTPSVKNLFELKNARRVLIEGNLFERNWVDAQNGFSILFTVRNQDGGAPWSTVEDVVFRGNVVRSVAAGFNLLGRDDNHPSRQLKRVRIERNLFEDVGGPQWGGNGCFLQVTAAACLTVNHNTIFHTGNILTSYGEPTTEFVFTNNLARHNEYGVAGDNVGIGRAALARYFPLVQFTGNVLAGGRENLYPTGNFFPSTLELGQTPMARITPGADLVQLREQEARIRSGK